MNEIKCPNCGQLFTVDEAGFSAILSQVRTKEFDKEIEKRMSEYEKQYFKDTEIKLNEVKAFKDSEISKLKIDIEKLKAESESAEKQHSLELQQSESEKETEIAMLEQQIENMNQSHSSEIESAVTKALSQKIEEINRLNIDIEKLKAELENSEQQHSSELKQSVSEKETEIAMLEQQIENMKKSHNLEIDSEVAKAVSQKNEEINKLNIDIQSLNSELSKKSLEKDLAIQTEVSKIKQERDAQKAEYEAELKQQRELVEYYKDFKARLSTKMVGESLEKHCENEFRKIQGYFPAGRVSFGKDNDVRNNSKGDFIYRELDEYGNELISIMFEMKNEMDTTAAKHKNEDFFKELDKDRRLKKCEYAVLVTLLEADNEYYNQGIVDVSDEQYEKMYVVRPQCFLTIISILRNAASNAIEYKRRVKELENQSIDITNFESKLNSYKDVFLKHYKNANNSFDKAIAEINKTIKTLESVRDNLLLSIDHFKKANNKLDDISIKKLTKDNPTMLEMFSELDNDES